MGVIYLRTNIVNGMQYVGQAKDFKQRQGSWNCLKWKYANQLLTDDRMEYGLNNFTVEILEECDDSKLDELERMYIEKYNTIYPNGYNDNEGGALGFHHSERTKRKISEANKGKVSWNKGKKLEDLLPEEQVINIKKKLSELAKSKVGEKNPFFGKTFITHPMKGKHHTEETKRKISEKNKNGKTSIPIIQIKDNGKVVEWASIREAARNGYDCGSISKATKGVYHKNGHHYKHSNWYYKDEYEKMLAEQSC